jgi:4-hydroxyphenylacetaldehyde oxime monooxygenase
MFLAFYLKSRFPGAKMLTYNYRDIAFSPYSERWRERRKLFISELVGSKRVQSFSRTLEEQVEQLIQSLSCLPPSTMEPVNLNEKIFALIDGFIGTVAFGRMSGAKLLKYKKFQQVFSEALVVLSAFSAQDFFPASPVSRWVDRFVGLEARYRAIFGELDAYFETVLSQHLNVSPGRVQSDKDNLVDVLIGLWKGQAVTKDDLKAIIMVTFAK